MKAILIKIHPIWKSNFLSLGIGQSSEQYFGQLSQKALIKTLISLKHKMNVPGFVPSFLPLQHEKQSSCFCFSSQTAFICNSKNLLGFCDYFSVEEKPSQQTILPGPCSQTSDNIYSLKHTSRGQLRLEGTSGDLLLFQSRISWNKFLRAVSSQVLKVSRVRLQNLLEHPVPMFEPT